MAEPSQVRGGGMGWLGMREGPVRAPPPPPPSYGCVGLGQTQSRVSWGCLCCKTLFPSLPGVEEPGKLLFWWCPSPIKGVLHSWLSMLGMGGGGAMGASSILTRGYSCLPPGLRGALCPLPWLWRVACLDSILPFRLGGGPAAAPLPPVLRRVTSVACE